MPPGASRRGELRRERAIGVEPVAAGEQRLVRLERGDVGGQVGRACDIRRVAQDEVEPLLDPLAPVAEPEFGARRAALRRA